MKLILAKLSAIALSTVVLWQVWVWSVAEPYQMNKQQKFISANVTPAVERGVPFPDSRALQGMIRSLRNYVERHPDDAQALMVLAVCYRAQSRWQDALEIYETILEIQPRGEVYLQMAAVQTQIGRVEEAEQNVVRAVVYDFYLRTAIRSYRLGRRARENVSQRRPWLGGN